MNTQIDLEYREVMLERIKTGVPHIVILNFGKHDIRKKLIKYHSETNTFTYKLGRNTFVLESNANIEAYHVFFDVDFTYKKERGEEFYRVFARIKCSLQERLEVCYCRSGVNLDEIKKGLMIAIEDHINNNPYSLGMRMTFKTDFKKYRDHSVLDKITATNFINSISSKVFDI